MSITEKEMYNYSRMLKWLKEAQFIGLPLINYIAYRKQCQALPKGIPVTLMNQMTGMTYNMYNNIDTDREDIDKIYNLISGYYAIYGGGVVKEKDIKEFFDEMDASGIYESFMNNNKPNENITLKSVFDELSSMGLVDESDKPKEVTDTSKMSIQERLDDLTKNINIVMDELTKAMNNKKQEEKKEEPTIQPVQIKITDEEEEPEESNISNLNKLAKKKGIDLDKVNKEFDSNTDENADDDLAMENLVSDIIGNEDQTGFIVPDELADKIYENIDSYLTFDTFSNTFGECSICTKIMKDIYKYTIETLSKANNNKLLCKAFNNIYIDYISQITELASQNIMIMTDIELVSEKKPEEAERVETIISSIEEKYHQALVDVVRSFAEYSGNYLSMLEEKK